MNKEFLKIGIAILVLFGLAIPLSLNRQKKIDKMIADEKNEKFITFDIANIQRMKLINSKGEVELERRKKDATGKFEDEFDSRSFEYTEQPQWIVIKPYRALADYMLVDSFFSQIKDLGYQKVIQETQERKKDYELDPAPFSVQFFDSDSQEPKVTINMGAENPSTTGFYFSTTDKPGIYLGERVLQPYKDQNISEWREKRIFGFPNKALVEKINIRHVDQKEPSFSITKEKEIWKIDPVSENLLADSNLVTDFLSHMDGMRAGEILEDATILRNSSLLGEVAIHIKDRKEPVQYKVFSGGKNSGIYYIQRSDLKNIFTINTDGKVLPVFQRIVSKKLINKEFNLLATLKIVTPSKSLEMIKEKEFWKMKKPFQDDASARRIESFMQVLGEIKPILYLKNKTLNVKNQKIRIEMGLTDQSINVVSLYQEGKEYFAKIEDANKPRIVSIPMIPFELFEHLEKMRSEELIPITKEHVKKIIFTRGISKLEIEIDGKKRGWYLKSLDNVPASVSMRWKEELTPEQFFNKVSEMYMTDFVTETDPEAKYDLATLEIISDNNQQFTWQLGQKQGEMINIYSPDRKITGRMPYIKYLILATFLDEPVKK